VGTFVVQLAARTSARVVAVARREHHDRLRELGAAVTIDFAQGDVEAAISRTIGTVDAVADLVGGDTTARSLETLRLGGRLAAIAELKGDLGLAIDRNVSIRGVLVRPDGERLSLLGDLLARGDLRTFVGATYPLEDAALAHERLEAGRTGKIVLCVGEESP
jgi:NADPH:quinone reductase-like Zn-dependent oxidoreductase